jgi:hypothetical protein
MSHRHITMTIMRCGLKVLKINGLFSKNAGRMIDAIEAQLSLR